MTNRLYVGNLDFRITSQDLTELFAGAGRVLHAHVIMDRETGQSKGFAFVEMADEAEAVQAISLYNGHNLNDRAMAVSEARERTDAAPRTMYGRVDKAEALPKFRQVRHKSRGGANKRRF